MEVTENASDDQQEFSGILASQSGGVGEECAVCSAICNERSADSNTRLCVQLKKLRKHPHHGIFSPSWDLEMTCCLVFSTKKQSSNATVNLIVSRLN